MSEEIVKPIDIYAPKFNFKLKGHTKIELNNPYRKQVFEDDNVVQSSIIEKQFRTMGNWNTDIFRGSWSPLWKYLFGGIYLFDMPVPVGSEYMPQGVMMTANGAAGTVNNAAPYEMGSWDAVKSSIDATECKMVYNWSQQQGNGDISSICLTSRVGGYIGYGNKDGVQKTTIGLLTDQYTAWADTGSAATDNPLPSKSVYSNSYLTIKINNSTKVVTVDVVPYVFDKLNVLAESKTLTFNYTNTLSGNMNITGFVADGKGKFAISERKATPIGSTRRILVLDMENETLDEYEITNNTDSAWATDTSTRSTGDLLGFDGTHVYYGSTRNSASTIYKIRISDSAVVSSIIGVDATPSSNNDQWLPVVPITPNHKMVKSEGKWCLWDEINNTKYPMNISAPLTYISGGNYSIGYGYHEQIDAIGTMPCLDYYNGKICVGKNPLYLATINNLQDMVTKTNEDSMVVTYTLDKVTT